MIIINCESLHFSSKEAVSSFQQRGWEFGAWGRGGVIINGGGGPKAVPA